MNALLLFLRSWKFSLLGLVSLLIGTYLLIQDRTQAFDIEAVQQEFSALELQEVKYANTLLKSVKSKQQLPQDANLVYHLYDKEILFGWSSNQLPVGRYKTALFPANGLIKLNNGWYYCSTVKEGALTCAVSFCLLKEYEFSNAYLNPVNPGFWLQKFQVNLNGTKEQAITNRYGDVVFYASALPPENAPASSNWAPFFFLIAGFLFYYQLQQYFQNNLRGNLFLLLSLVLARTAVYEIHWPSDWLESDWFSARFFAYNEWYPDFFAFAVNSFVVIFSLRISFAIFRVLDVKWLAALLLFVPCLCWFYIEAQLNIIIDHSNIPLSFEHLFDIRLSTYFFFALLGFFLYTYQKSVYQVLQLNQNQPWFGNRYLKFFLLAAPFSVLILRELNWMNVLPLLVIGIHIIFEQVNHTSWYKLSSQLLILSVNAAVLALYLQTLQANKDQENRKLFAQQLALERNINLELAYAEIAPNLSEEKWLQSDFDSLRKQFTKVGFEHVLTQRFLSGIWDGFDIDADLYDLAEKPCFGADSTRLDRLQNLVKIHGQPSDIQDGIYFMPHEEEGLSYVILLRIGSQRNLAITLVSKRIPEEIGFPRLLISDQAGISSSLEQYAIGKYAEGRLIHQSGNYNYPLRLANIRANAKKQSSFEANGFTHVIIGQHTGSAIVISAPQRTWFTNVTGFAFLFVFWGLLLLLHNIFRALFHQQSAQWSLSFKVQLAFLVILGLSLFLYGLGSSLFIGKQFDNYTQQALREKLDAVQTELKNQTHQLDTLDAAAIGKPLETKLAKLSSVFKTDLFVFDSDGFLIASSRPKLFAYGLIGEHMNPDAMDALIGANQSYFSHQDQIGALTYGSAYLPIINHKRQQIGFINLQLFGQQEAYEQQIENFLKAAINVFVLLLAISVFIALVVSNWLIGPLQAVARSVRTLEFGKNNQKITYNNQDEIGLLVKAYNEKLAELEHAAGQIARSERESAWRDLAQQIAHEIKNPLTPMKLSIQHLLRKIEMQDADAPQLVQTALPGLIEQIDALARMANEFARFAKLPEPVFEAIELHAFVEQVLLLFDEDQNRIQLYTNTEPVWILADKDMFKQVFHNLLLNAKQATDSRPNPHIEINITSTTTHVTIAIHDNGIGISKQEQDKIFTPYFTTKSSGSGIGLSVVRQIIEKHNGQIWFESEEGVGTVFYVKLNRNT